MSKDLEFPTDTKKREELYYSSNENHESVKLDKGYEGLEISKGNRQGLLQPLL